MNRRARAASISTLAALTAVAATVLGAVSGASADPPASRPNVVLILTDDQTLEEMRALPRTASWIGGRGTTFNRAYASYPLCCPARATILTGQYMHNHGVRGNSGAFGGWQAFVGGGAQAKALPTWLQQAGYYTVQIGKYMNGYTGSPPPIPPGWDEWYGKYSEYDEAIYGGRVYYNYRLREDPPATGGVPCPTLEPKVPGEPFTCTYGQSASDYQTDVIRDKAVEAIHRLGGEVNPQRPFFLHLSFNAPHSPNIPAPRHAGLYGATEIEPPAGSNEKRMSDKPLFLRNLKRISKKKREEIVTVRRARLEMLLSVDDAVNAIARALAEENELDNTYLIFTSDNGYFSGEHRIRQGKYLPHEPSSHVPLMISGPGIARGGVSEELVGHVDIADTIRHVTGARPRLTQDGRSLLPFAASPGARTTRALLLEGDTGPGTIDDDGTEEVDPAAELQSHRRRMRRERRELRRRCERLRRAKLCFKRGVRNLEQEPSDSTFKLRAPAFRTLRTDRYLLTLYSTGEIELYDMSRDPNQLRSVHRSRRYKPVRKWMLDRLAELAVCAGNSCSADIGPEPPRRKKKDDDDD